MNLGLLATEKIPAFINEPKPPLEILHLVPRPRLKFIKRGKFNETKLLSTLPSVKNSQEFDIIYNKLISEFSPLINWAISCWEYILSTKGVRYVERPASQKSYHRGDYKIFTENDYKRMVYDCFKNCCILYIKNKEFNRNFSLYLKKNFFQGNCYILCKIRKSQEFKTKKAYLL